MHTSLHSLFVAMACAGVAGVAASVTCLGSAQPVTAKDFVANLNPGWNPGNTMDAMPTETSWGQPLLVNSTFTNVKSYGFRGIRLPVTYADHFVSDAPDYTIDPVWLQRVSDVIDMITSNGMYAMVNSHHDSWSWLDPTAAGANQTEMQAKFYAMWYQIGTKLACKPLSVGFEALNEPSGSSASDAAFLNTLQATFVKAINDAGGWNSKRVVILGGMGDAYTNMVAYWKPPANITNPIALTYHYYGPWDWTATAWGRTIWGSESDKKAIADDIKWAHDNFTSYPMIIGEYATSPATTEAAARWKWYDFIVRTANSYGAACMLWDAGGSFQVNSSSPWPDPTTLDIIFSASKGIPNALADSSEDGAATSQWSSAYVWHKQGEAVVDESLPMLWNNNTLRKVTSSPGVSGAKSGVLIAGTDYAVVGSNLTFKAAFLKTLFPAGSEPGFKANLTLHFNRGADLKLMAYQYASPTLGFNIFKVTANNSQSDLAIPITWKGRVQMAAARHIFANGTYMADAWTQYLGPLQQARMTGGYTWDNSHVILQASELQLAYAGQTTANYTFEFFPREVGNVVNFTITI